MPEYDYKCERGHEFTRIARIEDRHKEHCPCGARAKILIPGSIKTVMYPSGFNHGLGTYIGSKQQMNDRVRELADKEHVGGTVSEIG